MPGAERRRIEPRRRRRRHATGARRSRRTIILCPVTDTIVTRAPTRIDFGGGWTDVPPYSDEVGRLRLQSRHLALCDRDGHANERRGRRVGAVRRRRPAIARSPTPRRVDSDCTTRSIAVHSDFPDRRGARRIVRCGRCDRRRARGGARRGDEAQQRSPNSADEIEIGDLGIAGGRQDHYAAAYGGALGLRFSRTGRRRDDPAQRSDSRARSSVGASIIYTGQSRISGDTIDAVLDAYRRRDPRVLTALAANARDRRADGRRARDRATSTRSRRSSREQWMHQRSLASGDPDAADRRDHRARTRRRRDRRESARRVGRRMRAGHRARGSRRRRSERRRAARRVAVRSRSTMQGVERCRSARRRRRADARARAHRFAKSVARCRAVPASPQLRARSPRCSRRGDFASSLQRRRTRATERRRAHRTRRRPSADVQRPSRRRRHRRHDRTRRGMRTSATGGSTGADRRT